MPDKLDCDGRKTVIIDDAIAEHDQAKLIKYFTSGRHSKFDTFYLTQRFHEVPKTIRDQLNLVISFDIQPQSAEAVYRMVNTGIDLKDFKKWYRNMKEVNGKKVPKVISRFGKCLRDGISDINE